MDEDDVPVAKRRRIPRTNKAWQLRLMKLQTRRDRSAAYVKDMEHKYKERWSNAIVDGDPHIDPEAITTSKEPRELRQSSP